jgi:hypothetical protein
MLLTIIDLFVNLSAIMAEHPDGHVSSRGPASPSSSSRGFIGGGRVNSGGGRTSAERNLDATLDRRIDRIKKKEPSLAERQEMLGFAARWLAFSAENPNVSLDQYIQSLEESDEQ